MLIYTKFEGGTTASELTGTCQKEYISSDLLPQSENQQVQILCLLMNHRVDVTSSSLTCAVKISRFNRQTVMKVQERRLAEVESVQSWGSASCPRWRHDVCRALKRTEASSVETKSQSRAVHLMHLYVSWFHQLLIRVASLQCHLPHSVLLFLFLIVAQSTKLYLYGIKLNFYMETETWLNGIKKETKAHQYRK